MQNHHLVSALDTLSPKFGPGTRAYWSMEPAKSCLIFVHGYGGRAVETWGDLQDLLLEDPRLDHCDIIFLGYESRSLQASKSMSKIYDSVVRIIEHTNSTLNLCGVASRPQNADYEDIFLVGHSLGGVLVRDVVINLHLQTKPWANRIKLLLFAPAHSGAIALELAGEVVGLSKWLKPFELISFAKSPVLRDLEVGSHYLKNFETRAQLVGAKSAAGFVAHGSRDNIVSANQFYLDPPSTIYDDQGHISCCKPLRDQFLRPFDDILDAL